jgi:hypothetical protein
MIDIRDLLGRHEPNGGEGLTLEDLYQLLKIVPFQVRRNSYIQVEDEDVSGISFSHSDQAQKYEFQAFILRTNTKES